MAGPSEAVLGARKRRATRRANRGARTEWYIDNVVNKVALTMHKRVTLATELVRSQVVENISTPVGKRKKKKLKKKKRKTDQNGEDETTRTTGRNYVVTTRSKPGEYPRAETTLLMKSIFGTVIATGSRNQYIDGFIGTDLDYGLILETKLRRSFLLRTLREQMHLVKKILNGPIK